MWSDIHVTGLDDHHCAAAELAPATWVIESAGEQCA
jgi:hypothetical protein